ncbi:MAG TPA: DUF2269 domain-containing protein [Pseudomonas sp.]|jgi:uncharacterized membrane protein|uniref:DUF2269 family protein n=1 Tax=Pseudomonas sp. TaxID=306 RepID=UPI002C58CFEF|nr:DUF2269 domain-containing protein [Pseudomonas sp.]HSX89739.1 DUF2269 domain-containing protein [Pseudomonas sp.]
MLYLSLKWLHILSATILVGVGFGTAFYKWMIDRSGDVRVIAYTSRLVVLADWLFTTPAIILQPLTGLWMLHLAGYSLSSPWIAWTLLLYALAGVCWLPVVWLQYRMRALALAALATEQALPASYWRYARTWFWLGIPAFAAMLAIYALMVFKPM